MAVDSALGYEYDALLTRPNQAMHEPPVCALFAAIDVNTLPTSYARPLPSPAAVDATPPPFTLHRRHKAPFHSTPFVSS